MFVPQTHSPRWRTSKTADERDQLMPFLSRMRQQRPQPKDPVADTLIPDTLAQQPDALYRLLQRCMALQVALDDSLWDGDNA